MSTNGTDPQRLDPLEVGTSLTSPARTITETDLVSFAALTGDRHPQHADAEWAKGSRFGERVAHGMLVLSYALGLMPMDPERIVALRGIKDTAFKRPVRIGDTIHVEARVEGVRPLDGETGLAELACKVVNQAGQTVVRARLESVCRLETPRPAPEPELDTVLL